MKFTCACWFAMVLGAAAAQAQEPGNHAGELKYVVIMTRHGVRPPLWTPERLNQYSSDPWPKWDVPAGHLTSHGAALIKLFGAYDRAHFAHDGLFSATGCAEAGHIYIYADSDQRTIATGQALAAGMWPGCDVPVHSLPQGTPDPLFNPVNAKAVQVDGALSTAAIAGRIGAHPEALLEAHRPALDTMEYVLLGCKPGTKCAAPGKQWLPELPSAIEPGRGDRPAEVTGPVNIAATLAENFLLEYTNGNEGKDLGWGRLTETNLREMMALHTEYAKLLRRTPFVGQVMASNLLSHMLRSMEQAVTGKPVPGALGKPGDRMLIVSGHDGNISNLSGMLDVSWVIPGYQPDDTPPGGALVFELWRQGSEYTVRTYYTVQTLEQMHRTLPLTLEAPPATAPLFLLGCSTAAPGMPCEWKGFRRKVEAAIDPAYVKN